MPTATSAASVWAMAAAACRLEEDYVVDWLDELQRVVGAATSFSRAALAAVVAVLDSFAAEDGCLPRAGWQARTVPARRESGLSPMVAVTL
jgi:hypothetical protein